MRLRVGALRGAFAAPEVFAAVVERLAALRLAAGFAAADARVAPAGEDLARVERFAVERLVDDLRADPVDAARAGLPSSPVHLPDITRCAASATASAMMEPSLLALDIMLLAAWDAVSAASRPASRILRRAAGLALIAAAAAASPAASISLLIAALASLSIVSFEFDEDLEALVFGDFAMVFPSVAGKDT